MEYLLLLGLLVFTFKGLNDFFTTAPKKKDADKDDKKCENCGVLIPCDDTLCFYCEIIDYRKEKRDKLKKKDPKAPEKHYSRKNHRACSHK